MGAIIAGSGFVSRMPRRCCAPAGSAGHAGAARVGRPRTCTLPAAEQTRRTGEIDIIFLVERLESLVANGRKLPLTSNVVVDQAAVKFVSEGKSVFCKFVKSVGKHVLPSGEVAVLDPAGNVIAVGSARMHGDHMRGFKAGVAVKVRGALRE